MAAPSTPGSAGSGPDDLGLSGAAIIVTGASSGIGAATARRLARGGASVSWSAGARRRWPTQAKVITEAGGDGAAACRPTWPEPDSPQRRSRPRAATGTAASTAW